MKFRKGYVSNSSSSSFIVNLDNKSNEYKLMIIDHVNIGKQLNMDSATIDSWEICFSKDKIYCETTMDNFDMGNFVRKIENKKISDFNITPGIEYISNELILDILVKENKITPEEKELYFYMLDDSPNIYLSIYSKQYDFDIYVSLYANIFPSEISPLAKLKHYQRHKIENFLQKAKIYIRKHKLNKLND